MLGIMHPSGSQRNRQSDAEIAIHNAKKRMWIIYKELAICSIFSRISADTINSER